MDWVETTGRTVEEAKEAALDLLGVDYSEAEFEVLEEPKSGFLGMSKRPARVRGRVLPATPKAKDGRRMRRRRPSTAKDDTNSDRGSVNQDRSDANAKASGNQQERNTVMQEREDAFQESEEKVSPLISRTELAVVAQHFLADLLYELDMLATVSIDYLDDEAMELSIAGDQLGSLIGQKGAVIAAVQELTKAVVQAHAGESAGRVVVDVDGYRKKRREALERFTRSVIEEVLSSGEERAFDPMISSERKIVHDVVASVAGVESRSEGEEPNRYVIIFTSSKVEDNEEVGIEVG